MLTPTEGSSLSVCSLEELTNQLEEILDTVHGPGRPPGTAAEIALRRANDIDREIQRRLVPLAPPPLPLFMASGGAVFRPAGGWVTIEGSDGGSTSVANSDLAEYIGSSYGRHTA